jgi:DNA polymerase-3 subunit gamma/tau
MSYQVLARKYRPKSFETLVGQEHVVRALTHALEQQRLHHAYLFTGTRGVGKTTLSRILAKSLNCEKGITATPCGVCDACTAIDAGRFVDYIEMDAASNRGVDEMAALLEQAIYAPSNARFKVYMIDEVHMLTNHAFNSMLKTLEEPPAHVKFILATTDPQKIPVTVLSRCLQFNLKQMPPGHIISHLENILGQEQITYEVPALRLLAHGAQGSMRDALSLTDQAIAYAAGTVSLDAVQNMLGALDHSFLIRLLDALAQEDGLKMIAVADEMATRSLSYKSALQDLGSLLHQIAVIQLAPQALAEDLPTRDEIVRLAGLFNKEEVQLYYQIVVHGRNELALAPDEYAGFSMCLLRMLAFRPSTLQDSATTPPPASMQRNPAMAALANASEVKKNSVVSSASLLSSSTAASAVAVVPAAPAVSVKPSVSVSPAATAAVVSSMTPPVSIAGAAEKPLSPAMAALAAARAASQKNQSGKNNAAPIARQVEEKAPEQKQAMGQGGSAAIVVPSSELIDVAVKSAPLVVAVEHTAKNVELEDSDMPPPWDDESFIEENGAVIQPIPLTSTHQEMSTEPSVDITAETIMPAASIPVVEAKTVPAPLSLMPIPEIAWDGHWPNLAASLNLRGIAQQLAQQSELISCAHMGHYVQFVLRVPLQTLLASGSDEKLIAALEERFSCKVQLDTQIGAVEQTANNQALAERAQKQASAEKAILADSFVQSLMDNFGASILTGSIRPI